MVDQTDKNIDKEEILENLLLYSGTQASGKSCAVCDEAILKVKTLYVELNGIKEEEIEKFSKKLNEWLTNRAPKQWNEGAIPCGANNPYVFDSVEYWIQEWVGHTENWEDANVLAQRVKLDQWSDNKTAAEHYIAAVALSNHDNPVVKHSYRLTGAFQVFGYASVKFSSVLFKQASDASTSQIEAGLAGWAHGGYFQESPFAGEFGKCGIVRNEDLPVRAKKMKKIQQLDRLERRQAELQKQFGNLTGGDIYNLGGSEVQKYANDRLIELNELNLDIESLRNEIPTLNDWEE